MSCKTDPNTVANWPWSSYAAVCGQASVPDWSQTDWILAQFGRRRASAIRKYVEFVHEGARLPSVWTQTETKPVLKEILRAQRRVLAQALRDFEREYARDEAHGACVSVRPARDGGDCGAFRGALFDGEQNREPGRGIRILRGMVPDARALFCKRKGR